jgi:hypothetical protein
MPANKGGKIPDTRYLFTGSLACLQANRGTIQELVHALAISVPSATPTKPILLTKIIDSRRFRPALSISENMNALFLPTACKSRPGGVPKECKKSIKTSTRSTFMPTKFPSPTQRLINERPKKPRKRPIGTIITTDIFTVFRYKDFNPSISSMVYNLVNAGKIVCVMIENIYVARKHNLYAIEYLVTVEAPRKIPITILSV